jgi:serine/threonine-protein kinase
MIHVVCDSCGLRVIVPDTVQGRPGLCFGCGAPVRVPITEQRPAEQAINFEPGTRIAERYIIEARIGKGGMGVVYKAHDALVDEEVALKFMHPRALATQRGQQLFIKEAQIARRLRHENIVSVHDVGTTPDGILYLTMELLRGTSLRAYLKKHRAERRLVDAHLAIDLTLQVLAALEYAHRMVVHRDLKPENVMLLPGDRAKVLDFGLAVAVEDEQEVLAPDQPKPRRVVGTAVYASPEQHRHQPIDFRSDLYSLGLVLHELLTLRTPVDEPVTVLEVREDVSPSIVEILDKAVMKEKERRWQSAREFREALRDAYKKSYQAREAVSVRIDSGRQISTEDMVYMPGGSFYMGCNDFREEAPEFETRVEAFYIDKYPVTNEQYGEFIKETGYPEPKYWRDPELNGPRQPVCGVTFDDALAYAAWAGKEIPTEPQWEFAARGKENRKYPWGSLEPETAMCNFGDYLGMPSIVTMHDGGATPDGVYDLAGNVHEWTLGAFVPYDPKNGGDTTDLAQPRHVVRGGSWHSTPTELRCSARKGLFREAQLTTVGFRCVLPANKVNGK